MGIVHIPIDTKSFYFNIRNDNATGHTPTVATPIKQGASVRSEMLGIYEIPENIPVLSREEVVSLLLSKSRTQATINRILVFNKISVNWNILEIPAAFCFYVREETDTSNIHFGRLKLHYPQTLQYQDESVLIDNRKVLKTISEYLKEYAFIIEAFDYDMESGVLNFDATIIGENNIPYSKVFINRRGVGNKFSKYFTVLADVYDSEIISLREKLGYENVSPDNFSDIYAENDDRASLLTMQSLEAQGATDIRFLKSVFPYSLFDIQCYIGEKKYYIIVKQTATKSKYFSLPIGQVQFCNDFDEHVQLWLYTDIVGTPQLTVYSAYDINHLGKSISNITYTDRRG